MIENLILKNLIYNEQYARKALPFLKSEYFQQVSDKTVFKIIEKHFTTFNKCPTVDVLLIELESASGLNDDQFKNTSNAITEFKPTDEDLDWLVNTTEKFCQDKAIYNAIMDSIKIIDGKERKDKGSIPELLSDALAVSFDSHIGHDFINDSEERYKSYHDKQPRLPFDLDYFNKITKGGLLDKTLTVVLAGCVHPDTKIRVRIRK